MTVNRYALGLLFCCFYVVSYFTNKYVLSVLKFTYPTLFQGWQTFVGGLLLLVSGRLGLVEISRFPRAVVLSWLPGSLLFVGNIYAGSRALSRLPIPMFFTLHNASEVVTHVTSRLTQKEHASWTKLLSVSLLLVSAVSLPLVDPQVSLISVFLWSFKFDPGGYFWAMIHCLCVGAYRVFQKLPKYSHLSDLEQQCINYIFSVLLLAVAAHPTGDLFGVFEFPFLQSYRFHSGCCASALLGFFLLLTAVKLKNGLPLEHCASWLFLAKILAACLSPFVFDIVVSKSALCCLLVNYAGEGLLVYSEYNVASR
ncbi:UDP-N-acetylglucosamine transporter TMEM241 isoform X1 [Paramormyrops kingsleyae]|uniref:UDP-N-acetylglucosamine transporter TMEM241 isoform X1 n=1 Tax=Paramormyrops kingsleyae TaxID=1676925 RepID=UPI000CD60023|nr:transmembrane protein 241 isoform X1 [Paramormyrops kingsleyae]